MVTNSDEADPAEIRARAIKLLARREHAPLELARKLAKRGYPAGRIDAVLAQLQADNLLSISRFAEEMTRARAGRGQGPLRIRAELASRGVDQVSTDTALAAAETDWQALAGTVRSKRFGAQVPEDFPGKAKQMRFLQRRGFTAEQIDASFE